MRNKLLFAVTTAIGLTAAATTAVAAPLPAGTKLTITPWVNPPPLLDGGVGCPSGSCFGMGVIAGFYAWTAIEPGTDGGIIIGKAQKSGGQEVDLASTNPGEVTAAWSFGGNYGTFLTAPNASGNIFDDASCTGAACGSNTTPRRTDLAVWNTAWGGLIIPMGSAAGCDKTKLNNCTADMVAGIFVNSWTIDPPTASPRNYELRYSQVVAEVFGNFPFKLILRGEIQQNQPPVITITPANLFVVYGNPTPFTITVTDPDGPAAPTCRVGTAPRNGQVVLNGCTSGTYIADIGFIGLDSFTLIANDGVIDTVSSPINVGPIIGDPLPTADNVNLSGHYGIPLSWTPIVNYASSCQIATPPSNGVASVASDCSTGSYTANIGFVGTDSFTYVARGFGISSPATVTAAITAPDTDTGCTAQYPLKTATLTGKQGHLTLTVTGHIVSVNDNGKEIKICPTTTARYTASTNTPGATVVCKVKSNTARGKGRTKVNDHIRCTDKPVGNDKLHVKIKSGVNR